MANRLANVWGQIPQNPPVHVVANQEARQADGYPIFSWLEQLPGYQQPQHITEQLSGRGRGYTALFENSLTVQADFQLYDLLADEKVEDFIASLPQNQRDLFVRNLESTARPPAMVELVVQGHAVLFVTWHAPFGYGDAVLNCRTQGLGSRDWFYCLEICELFFDAANLYDIVIVAGDLNLTEVDLRTPCHGIEILRNFEGRSSHLDHILAWSPVGHNLQFLDTITFDGTPSDHWIFTSRIVWG